MSPDLERLVGRAVMDPEFRDKLFADPEGVIKGSGLSLTSDEVDGVKKGIERMKQELTAEQIAQPFGAKVGGIWE